MRVSELALVGRRGPVLEVLFLLGLALGAGSLSPVAAQGVPSAILVSPDPASDRDVLTVEVSGNWQDACTPVFEQGVAQPVSMQGATLVLRMEAVPPSGGTCPGFPSPFRVATQIGPLPAGQYTLDVVVGKGTGTTASPWGSTTLDVVSTQTGGSVLLFPAAPTSSDTIRVDVIGTWRDSCVPDFHGVPQPVDVQGDTLTLRLDAVLPPDVVCAPVLTNFTSSATIGPLAPGSYTVEVLVGDGPGSTPTFWASRSFDVVGGFEVTGGVAVEPEIPVSTQNTRLLVWGVWRDGCVPRTESVQRSGTEITVLARTRDTVCTQATERFAFSADLGLLDPGTYTVRVMVDDRLTQQTYLTTAVAVAAAPEPDRVVLRNRFEAVVVWGDFDGRSDLATPVAVDSTDSSPFWFFDRNNWEMLVKVLDGCGVNGNFWVFASAATDVAFTLTVTDTQSGLERSYENPLGNPASAITDTAAFPCN